LRERGIWGFYGFFRSLKIFYSGDPDDQVDPGNPDGYLKNSSQQLK
jgi:hypothetical protein